jgi:hypothetical protein
MYRVAALTCVAACGFQASSVTGSAGDARSDVIADRPSEGLVLPDGVPCFGGGLATVCFTTPPPETLHVTTPTTIATDTDGNCTFVWPQASGLSLCVLAATTIAIDAPVTATGMRPLALVAADTLAVNQVVDVSSHPGVHGAGANAAGCVAPNQPEGDTGGGGGGAGGSFGGIGGDGGVGDGNNNGGSDGTAAPGIATATAVPVDVRGGCAGGISGSSDPNAPAGLPGGDSGGAVYLIAGGMIHVTNVIVASGAGGPATLNEYGGPGGGSGGLIGLDAPAVAVTGTLAANGGGGSEGGTNSVNGGGGNAGGDGTASTTIPAAGGTGGTTDAGDGGAGSVGATLAGSPGAQFFGGGGGGGGGAGYIYIRGVVSGGGAFSPAPAFH